MYSELHHHQSVASFALRQTVFDCQSSNKELEKTVKRNFYVNDLLISLDSVKEAIQLMKNVRELISGGGFRLTGFVSNSRTILDSVVSEDLATNLKNLDLSLKELPFNRAL